VSRIRSGKLSCGRARWNWPACWGAWCRTDAASGHGGHQHRAGCADAGAAGGTISASSKSWSTC
jgi:hypothetical protein